MTWWKWKFATCSTNISFPATPPRSIRGSSKAALEGKPEGLKSIADLLDAVDKFIPLPPREVDKPFLMCIEDVFNIEGRGTVVTGRVERGVLKKMSDVEIVGLKETRKTVATDIEMFRKLLDNASAGDNVGVLLRGTKKDEVERGMVLAKPGSITPHTQFKAEVYVLSKDEGGRHTPFFYQLPPAVLFSDDGRDRHGDAGRGSGNGDAWGQRVGGHRVDRPGGDGKRAALRHPRRRPDHRGGPRVARLSLDVEAGAAQVRFRGELSREDHSTAEGGSSIGRVAVSKTVGWGFESLPPCQKERDEYSDGELKV